MGKLSRYMYIIPSALLLGLMLTIVLDTPTPVCATCGSTMHAVRSKHTDRQTSDTKNGVTTDTEETTTLSVVVGDQGDVFTENSTSNKNSDGSSESHENLHNEDPEGCIDDDGEPMKADTKRDVKTDAKGNRKEHWEQIIEKNGKCIKNVRDVEWNAKGETIKDTGWIETEIPCSKWSLEVFLKGNPATQEQVGADPLTVMIPLEIDGNTYKGSNKGERTSTWVGESCSGSGSTTVSYDVTAKEEKFGSNDELNFSVLTSFGTLKGFNCYLIPPVQWTDTFTLPAEDGASWSNNVGETYTLKK